MPLSIDEIKSNYERYRQLYSDRDTRMEQVLLVRKGRMRDVFPDLFPDGPFENPIVANMVDISARDLSEVIAPLPAFNCNSPSMVSDKERKKAGFDHQTYGCRSDQAISGVQFCLEYLTRAGYGCSRHNDSEGS